MEVKNHRLVGDKVSFVQATKWNKTAEAAISQIENRNYPEVLKSFSGDILMVGINYDEKTKKHSCKINRLRK